MIETISDSDARLLVTLSIGKAREIIRDEISGALNRAPQTERLLDIKQAAEMLSVSEDWLYRNSKRLPFTRKLAPKMLRFSYQGIVKYLASRQTTKN
jgi:predicted DNA-binding transcriptional regulator AlpA